MTSSTEYVELASGRQTNHDEEQGINQEIAQLFWNNNNGDIVAETEKALEATSTCSPLSNDEINNREKERIIGDNNKNEREVSREERIDHFTSIADLSTASANEKGADELEGNVAVLIETEVTSSVFSSANQNK
uniref:Uncharacterized protein n=1 Tax=Romanomermis culicivorax TaxID=13658 RepID=A0A915HGT4_ROMCU